MTLLFIIGALILIFLVGLLINVVALIFLKRLFNLKKPTYRKATSLIFISGFVSLLLTFILSYLGLEAMAIFLVLLGVFVVFYLVLKKQYKATFITSLYIYILFSVITIAISLATILPLRTYVAELFVVSGGSMEPLFKKHDYVLAKKWQEIPERGDVVIYTDKDRKSHFIGRVIGLPGELVELRADTVLINNRAINESYTHTDATETFAARLKNDEYFILPDIRQKPINFKLYGRINKAQVVGEVFFHLGGVIK
jgi:signal peptidase I